MTKRPCDPMSEPSPFFRENLGQGVFAPTRAERSGQARQIVRENDLDLWHLMHRWAEEPDVGFSLGTPLSDVPIGAGEPRSDADRAYSEPKQVRCEKHRKASGCDLETCPWDLDSIIREEPVGLVQTWQSWVCVRAWFKCKRFRLISSGGFGTPTVTWDFGEDEGQDGDGGRGASDTGEGQPEGGRGATAFWTGMLGAHIHSALPEIVVDVGMPSEERACRGASGGGGSRCECGAQTEALLDAAHAALRLGNVALWGALRGRDASDFWQGASVFDALEESERSRRHGATCGGLR